MKVLQLIFLCCMVSLSPKLTYSQSLPDSILLHLNSLSNEEKVDFLGSLGWNQRGSNREMAKTLIDSAIALSEEYGFPRKTAKFCNYSGALFLHYYFNHKDAIPVLNWALELGLQTNDSTQIAYAYNNLGDAYYLNNNATMALEYGMESFNTFSSLGDEIGIAYSLVNLGLAHSILNDFDTAIEYFHEALDFAIKKNDTGRMANSTHEIANTKLQMGSFKESIDLFHRACDLYESKDNIAYISMCLTGIGDAYYSLGNYQLAKDFFNKALELNNKKSNDFNRISILLGIALVHSIEGNKEDGVLMLDEAALISGHLGVSTKLLECFRKSYEFYKNLGDYEEASEELEKFMNLADTSFTKQQIDALNESKERFQAQEKRREAETNLTLKKKNQRYLISIVFMLMVLVIVLIISRRRASKNNRLLKQINDSKDKLFSIISHDLRNPFIALKQYIYLLKEGDMTPSSKEWFINDLDQKTTATYSLLENLLNLSASRTGKISFQAIEINVSTLIQELLSQSRAQIESKNIKVELNLKTNSIFGDQNMLSVILRNLLSNAIKYSLHESKIIISAFSQENETFISVEDFGTGMNKETLKHLFSADFIDSVSGTNQEKGTGIGLSLCKEFVELHRGEIQVTSELNKGSTFTVILPSA